MIDSATNELPGTTERAAAGPVHHKGPGPAESGWIDPRGRAHGGRALALHRVSGLVIVLYLYLHLGVLSMLLIGRSSWSSFLSLVTAKSFLALEVVLIGAVLLPRPQRHSRRARRQRDRRLARTGDVLGRRWRRDRRDHLHRPAHPRSPVMSAVDVPRRAPTADPPAPTYRRGRSARLWRWTAGSGIALVALATLHIVAQHFVVHQKGGLRTYAEVLELHRQPGHLRPRSAAF